MGEDPKSQLETERAQERQDLGSKSKFSVLNLDCTSSDAGQMS